MVAAWCLGCGGPAPAPPPPLPPPVGAEAYAAHLRERAEVDLSPSELAAAAERDALRIEARLDELADRIAPGSSWRAVFGRLREDHPASRREVLDAYRRESRRARRFVVERNLMTLPEAPLEVVDTAELPRPERYPLTAYLGYRVVAATRSAGGAPRLLDHCAVCVPPLAIHETFPGHHAAFLRQRAAAGRSREETPEVRALAAEHFKNRFFHEGWAQYAELVMLEAGYYDGEPERELGAWRNLLLRATRARLDPLLHTAALSTAEAEGILARELLLSPELAREEVRRHLEEPGLKAAYYVGAVQVLALRRRVTGRGPSPAEGSGLQAFHDRFVERPMPVPEVARRRFGVELPGWPEEGLSRFLRGGSKVDSRR
ncbi:MAG: DUF885 family protein [Acidobacteriota bacterium]